MAFKRKCQPANFPTTELKPRVGSHTHTHIYIYIFVCVCVCVCITECLDLFSEKKSDECIDIVFNSSEVADLFYKMYQISPSNYS